MKILTLNRKLKKVQDQSVWSVEILKLITLNLWLVEVPYAEC